MIMINTYYYKQRNIKMKYMYIEAKTSYLDAKVYLFISLIIYYNHFHI